jgi:hypothetical protein
MLEALREEAASRAFQVPSAAKKILCARTISDIAASGCSGAAGTVLHDDNPPLQGLSSVVTTSF